MRSQIVGVEPGHASKKFSLPLKLYNLKGKKILKE